MPHKYEILQAQKEDIEEILRLQYTAYQSEAALYNNYSIQPLTQTLEQATEEFHESLVLKAVLDGDIIGSVRGCVQPDGVCIGKLMVLPRCQNQGIGKRLLQAIEDSFRGKRYWLFTGDKSEKNLALYEASGYARFKTENAAPGLVFVYLEKPATHIRELTPADYPLLEEFLYHALFLPPGVPCPPREIIFHPEVFLYIKDLGGKDDHGVVAERDGTLIGAAWTRIIPAFGHVDDATPELAISVLPEHRGQGVGTMMMQHLFEVLRGRGYKQTSLAVQQKNAAVRFYQRLGYETIRKTEEEYIMVLGISSEASHDIPL